LEVEHVNAFVLCKQHLIEDARTECAFDRSGNATHTILVNGRAAGVWETLLLALR